MNGGATSAGSGRLGLVLVAPALLLLAATLGWPLLSSLLISVQDVKIIGTDGTFMGLANYTKVLSSAGFWQSTVLSIIWVVANSVVQTALALVAALALHQNFPGVKIARTWIILTWIVPTVVVVVIWRWLFSTSGGMINPLLIQLGIIDRPIGFFGQPAAAMATLIFINSWRWFPFVALMMLAGLSRIPIDLYEAARIDGAGPLARFRRITWPLLAPTLGVLTVVGTLMSFNVFDIIWLITAGGPSGGTRTLPVLIYDTAIKGYRLSEATAASVLATILLMTFAAVATRALAAGETS